MESPQWDGHLASTQITEQCFKSWTLRFMNHSCNTWKEINLLLAYGFFFPDKVEEKIMESLSVEEITLQFKKKKKIYLEMGIWPQGLSSEPK